MKTIILNFALLYAHWSPSCETSGRKHCDVDPNSVRVCALSRARSSLFRFTSGVDDINVLKDCVIEKLVSTTSIGVKAAIEYQVDNPVPGPDGRLPLREPTERNDRTLSYTNGDFASKCGLSKSSVYRDETVINDFIRQTQKVYVDTYDNPIRTAIGAMGNLADAVWREAEGRPSRLLTDRYDNECVVRRKNVDGVFTMGAMFSPDCEFDIDATPHLKIILADIIVQHYRDYGVWLAFPDLYRCACKKGGYAPENKAKSLMDRYEL